MKDLHQNNELYTLGIWTIKPGKYQAFIKAWTDFAEWTSKHTSDAGKAYLLQDEKSPLRFISFGPWKDENAIQKWRESGAFKNFATMIKTLCDDFQPHTLKVAATSE